MSEDKYSREQLDLAVMAADVLTVKKTVEAINRKLDLQYVTKDELALRDQKIDLLQKVVYGVVGLILTAVVGGIVSLVVR